MNYNEIKAIALQNQLTIKELSEQLEITRQGFQKSIESRNLPWNKIEKLCELLKITPTDFFSKTPNITQNVTTNNGNVVGIDNRHYYSDSPDVLKAQIEVLEERIKEKDSQIKEKDSQIKEKDSQIKELLNILKNK